MKSRRKAPFSLKFKAYLLRMGLGRFVVPMLMKASRYSRKSNAEIVHVRMQGNMMDLVLTMNGEQVARGTLNDFTKEAQVWAFAYAGAHALMNHIDQAVEAARKASGEEILQGVMNSPDN